jgi:hypothetical protein
VTIFGWIVVGLLAYVVVVLFFLALVRVVPRDKDRLIVVVGPITAQGGVSMDVLKLTDEQQCDLAINPVTAHGHAAAIDGLPTWASSDSAVVEVVANGDDPKRARAIAKGLGTAQVSVTADADMGDGVRQIVSTLDIQVVAAEAVSLGISAGAPETQP